jgi:HAD superfamily hydrolase (TIGR01509 family)
MKKMIKAVIFDMDGVLIDAKDWHYEALNKALRLFGFIITRHEHLSTFDGLPTKNKLDILTEMKGLPRELHTFINQLKQIYTMEMVNVYCKPTFHHEYALAKLKASGLILGVASNSIRHTVEVMMDRSNLRGHLDVVLSNEDVKKPKPDPEIYKKAITLMGVSPSQTMIVEDNDHGIKAAKDSGANVMVVQSTEDVNWANILENLDRFNRN